MTSGSPGATRTPGGSSSAVAEHSDMAEQVTSAFLVHRTTIYRYLIRRTGSADRAEELTQEVFADAAAALASFRPGSTPVLALLYTFAQRRFADAARRDARRPRPVARVDDLADYLPGIEDDHSLAPALREALARLPPNLAVVAAMKLVQGRSFAEIAAHVGTSEVACRKRCQRALAELRSSLEREGLGP